MRLHPRRKIVVQADIDLTELMLSFNITPAEEMSILAKAMSRLARSCVKNERDIVNVVTDLEAGNCTGGP